jgi:hypothetical protein
MKKLPQAVGIDNLYDLWEGVAFWGSKMLYSDGFCYSWREAEGSRIENLKVLSIIDKNLVPRTSIAHIFYGKFDDLFVGLQDDIGGRNDEAVL